MMASVVLKLMKIGKWGGLADDGRLKLLMKEKEEKMEKGWYKSIDDDWMDEILFACGTFEINCRKSDVYMHFLHFFFVLEEEKDRIVLNNSIP